ncbi:frataxin, mitochondrial isoform X1 [Cucurbita pepo subsp. pepo]|uniref:frataxin, mitochondrial isoform X1 n=1 Tax=Cucurbita pepo subsp. pepo TaxID=3664 RepID=UPI000C9D97AA|nr:frataxin, mitochondrial isoform X1 [Cucurbita pepo subsp. pepo]
MATKLLPLRKLSRILKVPSFLSSSSSSSFRKYSYLLEPTRPLLDLSDNVHQFHPPSFSRSFCSRPLDFVGDDSRGPATIDYSLEAFQISSLMHEGEFHRLADSTIHGLQEKLEEFGDDLQIDGFDVDYGNEVLTLRLGDLGTYVLNKQTPNRQIWLSSPASGPSRFDWDQDSQAWIYRRNKANLLRLLETELAQLCGKPINLS